MAEPAGIRTIPAIISVALILIIWFVIPVPEGVDPNAWHLLALFVGTIAAIIGKVMPIGAIAMVAIMLVAITGVTNPSPADALRDALSGFSNGLIWLIGIAIMISRGLSKSGLGSRIAYGFISKFGKKTLGIGYALVAAETLIAPVTPSNTARGGGIIHPIMKPIAASFGSDPAQGTEKKLGRFLALVNYNTNPISSAMFITATAPNPLVVKLIFDVTEGDISISWTQWALAALVPGIVALVLMPLVIYVICPPELKDTPEAPEIAKTKLTEMGPMNRDEKIMISVFALLLLLWAGVPAMILGAAFAFNPTTVAFLGLSILLVTSVLSWNDILSEKSAWDTITWFAALVMMASFLGKLGLTEWFSLQIQTMIEGMGIGWVGATLLLVSIYFYAHYFFASTTAHITAMFAAFFAAGIALGAPPMFLALLMAGASSLMMSLTHYGTGTAPIIFASGYATLKEWWLVGFVMSVINLSIWVLVGGLWWKILGHW